MINFSDEKMKRQLLFWFGSYLIIAIVLFFYFHIPLIPVIGGGVLAFLLTFIFKRK